MSFCFSLMLFCLLFLLIVRVGFVMVVLFLL